MNNVVGKNSKDFVERQDGTKDEANEQNISSRYVDFKSHFRLYSVLNKAKYCHKSPENQEVEDDDNDKLVLSNVENDYDAGGCDGGSEESDTETKDGSNESASEGADDGGTPEAAKPDLENSNEIVNFAVISNSNSNLNNVETENTSGENEPCDDANDDCKLLELLKEFDLEILFSTLKLGDVTYRSLQYLSKDDISTAIHHIGYRAEFREKLFAWRGDNESVTLNQPTVARSSPPMHTSTTNSYTNTNNGTTDAAIQVDEILIKNLKQQQKSTEKKQPRNSIDEEPTLKPGDFQDALNPIPDIDKNPKQKAKGYGHLPKGTLYMRSQKINLQKLLRNCHVGRTIMLLYNKNGYLEIAQRAELVRIIVDDVIERGERLTPKDYGAILLDIIAVFPNEKSASDYYFIYRSKCNPLGRLYQHYCSKNAKRRKQMREAAEQTNKENLAVQQKVDAPAIPPPDDQQNDEEAGALALKDLLASNSISWEEVCSKWLQTWPLRQKELKQFGLKRLLNNWPKLGDSRAAELFYIDFKHSYPGKENHLFAKWGEFSEQMLAHYERKIHADYIRKWIKYSKTDLATKDERDFSHAIGLIGLLPTTKNFKDDEGKLRIRATIKDSLDAFVMTLTTLDDFESQLKVYQHKFYPVNRTPHPFLVVISKTDLNISKIYVVLENRYYCMKSFLHALDLCYKIYHVTGLRYPTMCENVWTFVQRYFYNMSVPWEARNPNLSSLIGSVATPT